MVRRPESVVHGDLRRLFERGSLAGLSEGELLDRFATQGDEAAFEAIVRRHGTMVLGVCRRMLGDRHSADDAFQATFLVLARRAGAIRDGDRLGPWLFGVAHRVARRARGQHSRRQSRERQESADVPDPDLGASARLDRSELLKALDDEIARLPEAQRRPIVLCYLSGLTIDQAADRLGIPVGTARSRLARGRDRLRMRLVDRGYDGKSTLLGPLIASWTGTPGPSLPLLKQAVALAAGSATSKTAGVATTSASILFLADGAQRTMTITHWIPLAAGLIPTLAGGTIGLATVLGPADGDGGDPASAPAVAVAASDDAPRIPPDEAARDAPQRLGTLAWYTTNAEAISMLQAELEKLAEVRDSLERRPLYDAKIQEVMAGIQETLAEVQETLGTRIDGNVDLLYAVPGEYPDAISLRRSQSERPDRDATEADVLKDKDRIPNDVASSLAGMSRADRDEIEAQSCNSCHSSWNPSVSRADRDEIEAQIAELEDRLAKWREAINPESELYHQGVAEAEAGHALLRSQRDGDEEAGEDAVAAIEEKLRHSMRLKAEQMNREAKAMERRAEQMNREAKAMERRAEVMARSLPDGHADDFARLDRAIEDAPIGRITIAAPARTAAPTSTPAAPARPVPPAPPAAPARPDAPPAPEPAKPATQSDLPDAPRRPDDNGPLQRRLSEIERRLDRLDAIESKLDRLLESLGPIGDDSTPF